MSDNSRALVLKSLLDRALELMADSYRKARDRQEDPKRIELMVAAGRELRAWQQAAETAQLPPEQARPLTAITEAVERFAGTESELYEAVLDASRVEEAFGNPAEKSA